MKMPKNSFAWLTGLAVLLLAVGCDQRAPTDLVEDKSFPPRPSLGPGESNWTPSFSQAAGAAVLASLTTTDLNAVTPSDLVTALLGTGPNAPTVSNVTYSGVNIAGGTFSGGTGIIGFATGIILSSGNIASVPGPNTSDGITTNNGFGGDADLNGLVGSIFTTTFDAAVLEFDFVCPVLQVVSFQYVFTSDEYNEFVNDVFNDVFGFFLNGVNIALIPSTTTPVSINNVNGGGPIFGTNPSNSAFYINNDLDDLGGAIDTEMDGLTVVLTATGAVNTGTNHIKLAIADAGDHILDSNVFLQGGSFVCAPPQVEVEIEKEKVAGPDPIGIYQKFPTQYVFEINYSGSAAVIEDAIPAEFEVTDLSASGGTATSSTKGNILKSATHITWLVTGSNTLTVTIQTRESPGKRNNKKEEPPVFKPTSCGPLPINNGATAFEEDPDNPGEKLLVPGPLDPETGLPTLVPVVIVGPSNSLVVEAVAGAKPCEEG